MFRSRAIRFISWHVLGVLCVGASLLLVHRSFQASQHPCELCYHDFIGEENLPRNKTFKQRAEGDKNDQDPRRHGGQARRAGMERNDPAVQAERWETAPEMKQLGVSPDPRHLGSAPIPYSPTIHNVQISFQNFSDSHHLNGQYW